LQQNKNKITFVSIFIVKVVSFYTQTKAKKKTGYFLYYKSKPKYKKQNG